jgi:hypothetical protein
VVKREAPTPPNLATKLLQAAGTDLVLIGGQALAMWLAIYGLVEDAVRDGPALPAISNDFDFLTRYANDKSAVERMARAIEGRAIIPNPRLMTALVGNAVLDLNEDEYVNVDVLFKVFGLDEDKVRENAKEVVFGGSTLRVMHPLDVLHSRLQNLYLINEKQDDKGVHQLALAVQMSAAYLRQDAIEHLENMPSGRAFPQAVLKSILRNIRAIEHMALSDAGRKVAKRYGVHVADAIDPSLVPAHSLFWTKKLPQLAPLMSPGRAAEIELEDLPHASNDKPPTA